MTWRRSLGFGFDDIVVLFVGRVVLEKGIDIFIDSLSRTKNLKALIVGDGPEREKFAQKFPQGKFTGYLEGEALARAYASADIFFNPSVTETFGNVTLEAMASGAPAVCANAAGSASLVQHGLTGLLAQPHADAFGQALTKLANDRALLNQLSAAARRKSFDYSWDTILGGLVDNYYSAMGVPAPAKQHHARAA